MKLKKAKLLRALLLDIRESQAGSFTNDKGEKIAYSEATQIDVLSWEGGRGDVLRLSLSPEIVSFVLKEVENVHWGALIEVVLDRNVVTSVKVLEDIFSGYYDD